MKTFISGTTVTMPIETSYNDYAVIADAAQFRLLGANDAVIVDWTNISGSNIGNGEVTVVVNGSYNTLSDDVKTEARVVELKIDISSPVLTTLVFSDEYIVKASGPSLVLMKNSFQRYTDALALASELSTDLTYWDNASTDERVSAMSTAFYQLSRMTYNVYEDSEDWGMKQRAGYGLDLGGNITKLHEYSAEEFNNLPPSFIQAIRIAQIIDADERLGGFGTASQERQDDVVLRKIGESSTMFRTSPRLRLTVSRRALERLKGYIVYSKRTAR